MDEHFFLVIIFKNTNNQKFLYQLIFPVQKSFSFPIFFFFFSYKKCLKPSSWNLIRCSVFPISFSCGFASFLKSNFCGYTRKIWKFYILVYPFEEDNSPHIFVYARICDNSVYIRRFYRWYILSTIFVPFPSATYLESFSCNFGKQWRCSVSVYGWMH